MESGADSPQGSENVAENVIKERANNSQITADVAGRLYRESSEKVWRGSHKVI